MNYILLFKVHRVGVEDNEKSTQEDCEFCGQNFTGLGGRSELFDCWSK